MSFLANHFIKQSTNNDRHRELCYEKHLLTLTLSSILAIPVVSHAEFKGGFADIGVHYLDWTSRTTEKSSTKSHKDDFGYLEFEGGANFSWGEMYGFFDWENFYNGRHNKPVASSVIPLKIPTVFTRVTPDLISTCMRMAPTVLRIA